MLVKGGTNGPDESVPTFAANIAAVVHPSNNAAGEFLVDRIETVACAHWFKCENAIQGSI